MKSKAMEVKVMTNNFTVKESTLLKEKYYYLKHKSGLGIYVFPKDLTTSYAMFGTDYGSIDNRFKVNGDSDFTVVPDGIAHFLEHKMFENEDGMDTFEKYALTGASANAYTSFNKTVYLFSTTENVYESLEILLDFVTHPYFTPETVQKEQGIIAQEIRMGEDNPGRALLFGMLKSLYHNNPVRIEVAGTVESISEITADVLYKCYNTFYNLNNMALVVCGNITPDGVIEIADKLLREQSDPGIVCENEAEPDEVVTHLSRRKMQVAKPMFAVGFKNPKPIADPTERLKYSIGLEIANNVMFGPSSEFYAKLYSEGLINGSLDPWSENTASYSFNCLSGESDSPEEVYRRIVEYIPTFEFSEDDIELNRRVLYAHFVKSFDSTEEISGMMIDSILDGGELFEYTDVLETVDLDYVRGIVKSLYDEKYYTLTIVEPLDK